MHINKKMKFNIRVSGVHSYSVRDHRRDGVKRKWARKILNGWEVTDMINIPWVLTFNYLIPKMDKQQSSFVVSMQCSEF